MLELPCPSSNTKLFHDKRGEKKTDAEGSYHHLITEFVIEGVWEEACDRGQAVHNIERQAAVIAQHHQQWAHVSVDLIHFNSGTLQKLQQSTEKDVLQMHTVQNIFCLKVNCLFELWCFRSVVKKPD